MTTYVMRARNAAGNAYVSWVSTAVDITGADAPVSILPGSAVLLTSLASTLTFQRVSVSEAPSIQDVNSPATVAASSSFWLVVNIDTSAGTWSASDVLTLRSTPAVNTKLTVKDVGGQASTKPILIDGNGNLIDGEATHVLSADRAAVTMVYDGSGWSVI
jgi:hypothetical protein